MKTLKFLFGIHNHQPVGNFDHVFEDVFEKCYRPYLEVLQKFPGLKTAVHYTGPLLEWLKEHHPDFLKRVRDLVHAGRLEILSGGFYEPLLSILPEEDAIGQIRMMNDFIREEFGAQPRGLWLAERIWTPELPRLLHQAGIEYTLIDDTHFYYSGLEESRIHGYYVTEKLGHPLYIFPILKSLRYAIPFKLPEETTKILRRAKDQLGFEGVTYADDGEKFGSWPETYQWVYTERWLDRFFTTLQENADWVETMTFSEFIDTHSPTGRAYLPMASYDEMMEWSLPPEAAWQFHGLKQELADKGIPEERYKIFLRGGHWDNFLTKYEESNQLHKKMLIVSRRVNAMPEKDRRDSGALQDLYRAQCNCAQWHGLFGGLYLNYLRHALYQNLIAAENKADRAAGRRVFVDRVDYNLDGREEIIFSNETLIAYFAPGYGGSLVELDYRPACFNVSNVLRRREEMYHKILIESAGQDADEVEQPRSIHDRVKSKEADLQNQLFFDRWEKFSFLDHFLGPDTTLETFKQCRFEEQGDFVSGAFAREESGKPDPEKPFVFRLTREGTVVQHKKPKPVLVEKEFTCWPDRASIQVRYRFRNRNERPLTVWWGVELNFSLLAGDAEDRYFFCPGRELVEPQLRSEGILDDVETLGLRDDWSGFQLTLTFSPHLNVWRYPVETISQSEDGFERTYQGSCLLAHRHLELPPGGEVSHTVVLNLSP